MNSCRKCFHMLPGGVIPWERVERIAARVQAAGWHSQIQFDGRDWPERIDLVRRLPGTLVIDHTGKFLEPVVPDHAAFKLLLGLVGEGRTYVKLSAPYDRTREPGYANITPFARALIAARADRMLWGTNWPHPLPQQGVPITQISPYQNVDNAMLVTRLAEWCPDAATRKMILVDTPERLYRFSRA